VHPPLALYGRASESERLAGLVAGARAGHSGVLVLRGEAGIGKTALLQQLIAAADGLRVVRLVGIESDMELAFAGLHQICAPLLNPLTPLPEPQRQALNVAFGLAHGESPDAFLVALATLTLLAETSEGQPLLCVVDDAQWLDHASAQVLGFVGRRLLAEPIALVFAERSPVAAPDHFVGLPELTLHGLDEGSARALLAIVYPGPFDDSVRARIIEETGGNPLALLELFNASGPAELAGGFALPHGDLPRHIEDEYIERLAQLPPDVQRVVLLAAADPAGDPVLIGRAAELLRLNPAALSLAVEAGLLDVGAHVRFRHPLVRSAAYRSASIADRRTAHGALATATEAAIDPDRRAWHRARAAAEPDETVAEDLLRSAGRAERRGGVAASAAFWAQAVALTVDARDRASRALTAAEAKYAAGDFASALSLLATAEVGPLDDLGRASVERMRAQVAFALRRGNDAPPLLLRAGKRLESLDPDLARETYLQALVAAVYAGRFSRAEDQAEIARLAKSGPREAQPASHSQLLLRGLALRLSDGYIAAAPLLKEALRLYRVQSPDLGWLGAAYNLVAMDLWDDDAWFDLAAKQRELARASGTLSWLPFALDYLAEGYLQAGELSRASALLLEAERIDPGIRQATLPYVPSLLAAWRGDAATATQLTTALVREASTRGEGAALTYADYAIAVLYNGIGKYERAGAAADRAVSAGDVAISPWALAELVEGASRSGQHARAQVAADQLSGIAVASGTAWARGAAASSRALVSGITDAEGLHLEAIDLLSRTRMAIHVARARLAYGEWLRRQNRRVDARRELRLAYEQFAAMGVEAFRERARRELSATGERVRKRNDATRTELTPQEQEIAELARAGRTNPEIGAQLFISARTVEWHLKNVFGKLGINSRRELATALMPGLTQQRGA